MNSNKIILCIVAGCIATSGLFLLFKNNSKNDVVTNEKIYSDSETQEIINGIGVINSSKTSKFDSLDEVNEYIDTLNSISGPEEASDFIKSFLDACESNRIDNMVVFFNESYWGTVIQNQLVPAYDKTNTYSFKYSDLSVKPGSNENEFIANYTLTVTDNKTNKKHSQFYREDTFVLMKIFEDITIESYVRNTLDYKTF